MKKTQHLCILAMFLFLCACNFFNKNPEDSKKNNEPKTSKMKEPKPCSDKEVADMIKDSIIAGKLRSNFDLNLNRIVAFNYNNEVRQIFKFIDPYYQTTKTYIKKPGGGAATHNQVKVDNKNKDSIVFSSQEIPDGIQYDLLDPNGNAILIAYKNDVGFVLENCKFENGQDTQLISVIVLPEKDHCFQH